MISKQKIKQLIAAFQIGLLMLGMFSQAGMAQQMSIARIQITKVDTSAFPDVQLTTILRDGNNQPVPISDMGNLELLENDQPVTFTHQQVSGGLEVLFVFDIGVVRTYRERNPQERLATMRQIVQGFTGSMVADDTSGAIQVTPAGLSYLQPITKDRSQLIEKLNGMTVDDFYDLPGSSGLEGVREAISELSKSSRQGEVSQTVLLFSSGIQRNPNLLDPVIDRAKEENVVIHVIGVNADSDDPVLLNLAERTGGLYRVYSNETSVSPIHEWMKIQRQQMTISFRSSSSTNSDRTLELRTRNTGGAQVTESTSYRVDVKPPEVIIDNPANNLEIVRQAASSDADLQQVEPTLQQVTAHVRWPDGHERAIVEAQFWLDGARTGASVPYPGETVTFNWDIRSYSTPGKNSAKLQVQVKDEFGLENISTPVDLTVTLIVPETSGMLANTSALCRDLEGFPLFTCKVKVQATALFSTPMGWLSILSMLIAVVAVVMALRFRGHIAEGTGQAVSFIRETIAKYTKPANSEIGGYLEVLRGDETLLGKQIPLYIRTVTPAGRSPQESELVFDMTNERSVVSRRHCEFRDDDGVFKVRDLGSTHGTYVNGIRLPEGGEGQVLSDGDRIELGPAERGGVMMVFKSANGLPTSNLEEEQPEFFETNPAYREDY